MADAEPSRKGGLTLKVQNAKAPQLTGSLCELFCDRCGEQLMTEICVAESS